MSVASVEQIRAHFPALERRHAGLPVAYFDGPGGTQVPRVVVDAMADYLYHHNANTHWAYPSSVETDAALDGARAAIADFLNAAPGEITLGANMTTLTFHYARALSATWGGGDEVIITELDHHANVAPWQRIARERGLTLRVARMIPETGQLDYNHLESLLNSRTRILAIGAASNAIGTVNDLPRAIAAARAAGALTYVDAVHYAPHDLVDVRALDCDFLGCSAYKFHGPHIGIVYGKAKHLHALDFPRLEPAPETPPDRAETGTLNHEGIVGAAAAVDFLASLGTGATRRQRLASAYGELHRRGMELAARLWHGLEHLPGVRLFGPPPGQPRTPTVSFAVAGVGSTRVCELLAERALFLSNGDFYAKTAVERLGMAPDGIVRAGGACYTTADEVDRLVEGVRALAGGKG